MHSIKLVIFDWSGVISDDFEKVYHVQMKVLNSFGIEGMGFEEFKRSFKLPYMDYYRKFGIKTTKEEINRRFYKFYEECEIKPKLISKVKETLRWLVKRGKKVAILSGAIPASLNREIKEYSLTNHINFIKSNVNDKIKAIGEVIKHFRVSNREVIYVGDMEYDIITGKSANVYTAVVLTGYHDRKRLEKHNPDFILEKLSDLKKIPLCY